MILDQPLKVGRPKTYTGTIPMMDDGVLPNTVAAALQTKSLSNINEGRKIQFPTKIMCFKGLVRYFKIDDDDEYADIIDDIKDECNKYGKVVNVVIPRKDVEDNPTPGMGNIYVEFNSLEECKQARKVNYFFYFIISNWLEENLGIILFV